MFRCVLGEGDDFFLERCRGILRTGNLQWSYNECRTQPPNFSYKHLPLVVAANLAIHVRQPIKCVLAHRCQDGCLIHEIRLSDHVRRCSRQAALDPPSYKNIDVPMLRVLLTWWHYTASTVCEDTRSSRQRDTQVEGEYGDDNGDADEYEENGEDGGRLHGGEDAVVVMDDATANICRLDDRMGFSKEYQASPPHPNYARRRCLFMPWMPRGVEGGRNGEQELDYRTNDRR
jgi:hypothetical protein